MLSQSLVHQGGVLGGPSREPLCPNSSRGPVRKPPRKHLFLPSITHSHRPPDLPPSHGPHGLEPQYGNLPPKTALFEVSVLARSRPAAVPMLPPGSARKRLAGNSPSNPANRWGPRLRGCTGGVCMYYVPLFREVLYIRYGTPLPLRESASTTIRGYRFPAEHRNSGTRTLSERAAEPRERPGRRQRAAPPCPPPAAEQTNTNATDK